MLMTVAKFRREAVRRRGERERGAPRYPEQMREFAVSHVRSVRSSGGSVHAVARELGISEVTLGNWLGTADNRGKLLREVRVSRAAAPRASAAPGLEAVVVTAPSGHVVSGLSVQQAAELLRALG